MQEIAINKCHGGFSLSIEATKAYWLKKDIKCYAWIDDSTAERYLVKNLDELLKLKKQSPYVHFTTVPKEEFEIKDNKRGQHLSTSSIERSDKDLIEVIKLFGKKANGTYADLNIIEIPDNVKYVIEEYDGAEWIAEKHKTWS